MSLFSSDKKKKFKRRQTLCEEADIFIQVHFVRERNSEKYKFNTLTLKDDPDRTACKEWYEAHNNPETFADILHIYLEEKKIDPSTFVEKCQLDKNYLGNIKSNNKYTPSKGEAVIIACGLKLNYEETRAFLRSCNYSLTNSEKSDLIIRFFLENHLHNVNDMNYVLEHFEQPTLKDILC